MKINPIKAPSVAKFIIKLILLFFLTIILSEICLSIYWGIMDSQMEKKSDYRASFSTYKDTNWAQNYFRELNLLETSSGYSWHPYVYWRTAPFKGQYINIDSNGIRHTWSSDSIQQKPQKTIFVFGGSTTWGTGVRDDYTIPSDIARLLSAKGVNANVINFGENVYISNQEVITLLQELNKGHIPDLVIFYDGVNDTYVPLQYGKVGIAYNEERRVEEYNLFNPKMKALFYRKVLSSVFYSSALFRFYSTILQSLKNDTEFQRINRNLPTENELVILRDDVLRNYKNSIKEVSVLGKSFGFSTFFYWQPVIYSKKYLTDYEKKESTRTLLLVQKFFPLVYGLMERTDMSEFKNEFQNISSIFSDTKKEYFIDPFHLSEDGNQIIAEKMVKDIEETILTEKRTN